MNKIQLSNKLKKLRKHLGITQNEMAKKFNVSMPGYRLWEIGATGAKPEHIKTLEKLISDTWGENVN